MALTFEYGAGASQPPFESPTLLAASSLLPAGIYTTLRTYRGHWVLRPEAHAERLSAAGGELTKADILAATSEALQMTRYPESRLRLTFAASRLFVSVEPFEPLDPSLYAEGVACRTVDVAREDPGEKKTDFIEAAARAYRSLPPGIHEGLLLARDGAILEGLSSNVFFIVEDELRTEEARALPGVTRSVLLEVAAQFLRVRRDPLALGELTEASEAFLTSVSRGVLGVSRINDVMIGSGRPGPQTLEVSRRFDVLVDREAVEVP